MTYGIVGDIGGTNARFGVVDVAAARPEVVHVRNLLCAEHESLEAALEDYVASLDVGRRPAAVALAVAGPVVDRAAVLTNCPWSVSEAALMARGFDRAQLLNDFEALGLAASELSPAAFAPLGPPVDGDPAQPIAVLGAGTGFGAAILSRAGGRADVLVTEAGHIGFAPTDEVEAELARIVARKYGRTSVERLLSGPGLRDLYAALAEMRGVPADAPAAAAITGLALTGGDPLCVEVVERFCAIYGAVAGDIALAAGARGGVYLAGGIAPQILPVLSGGAFRAAFEAKGRLSDYVRRIPTRVILQEHAALMGAAKHLKRL